MKFGHLISIFLIGTALTGLPSAIFSQIPRQISYQGLLISPGGVPISNGTHVLQVNFYDAAGALTALYSESQPTPTENGLFNLIIGKISPLPGTLDFSKQYWIGVSVDGGAEMSPRTALTSVPYALHAEVADRAIFIDANAKGVVTSINEVDGPIRIIGDSTTKITQSGGVLTISALPDGVQTIQNLDGTISIQNANGPVVTIGVADSSISTRKLQDAAVTGAKINQMGALTNQVLKWNGTRWSPGMDDTTAIKGGTGIIITTDVNGNNVISTTLIGLPPGTDGATLRYDGKQSAWIANTFLYNNGTSIGIGTTTPSALLDMAGNMMISNTGNVSNELRIQEPLSTGPSKHFTSFRAPAQTQTISYLLPPALAPADAVMTVNSTGVMSWVNVLPPSVAVPFQNVTTGINSGQDLQVGTGSILHPVETGKVVANQLSGASLSGTSYAGRVAVPMGTTMLTVNLPPTVGCTANSSVTVSQFDVAGYNVIVAPMISDIKQDGFTVQFSASYPTTTGFITYLIVNP